ncbi:DUF2922 domain-containing protein [Lactiplantibacillus plantarum]|uniref:DUF2922 domain-containing protein n=1 Tax=Lactiplantibacillus plantarum TaxID=1590 RepID=UPI001AAE8C97|nr:DUF2922 domain-containing protein [Lactiplantibacillus plantarum]MBX0342897.1 DUF2922 domain-containing protein [Lactiplantibacillus plantarum]MCG0697446.1 hypothetical protein [Lactiplantibacillus plantarum]MCG0700404.1 hypothetical protein [Lactiplantibacillus plantarum]MCG0703427.1 hypothetical protein [Lactiplantibacillus plantarum]MCG0706376.1 hypothetical protein [Lactiplantibacillus plantarum]
MKTLDLSFKTSTNKVHHLKLHYANDNLSKDVVSKAMADLAATNLFVKDGENLVAEPLAAKYVETIETPIVTAPKA